MMPTQSPVSRRTSLLALATSLSVNRRSLVLALVIGTALTLANQSRAVFNDSPFNVAQLILSYATPFVVISLSQAFGIRAALTEVAAGRPLSAAEHSFAAVAASHGIPRRAVVVALAVGSILAIISQMLAVLKGAALGAVFSWSQFAQGYALPLLFSTVSQTIAFRRAFEAALARTAASR